MIVTTVYETTKCFYCGNTGHVEVPLEGVVAHMKGALIQDAFPTLSAVVREQIMTGTHPECWDRVFGSEYDD